MNSRWPTVRLGEVLSPVCRGETVDPSREYRLLGVRLDGNGPFLREIVTGAQTAAHKFYRVFAGDFIYSRLFASRGAFGIIDDSLDGCYVSSEFPAFVPKADRVDAAFLRYWFRLPGTLAHVNEGCSGSTPLTRNRLREEAFLKLQISLPPFVEQKRLLSRIDEIASRINEARALREQAAEETEAMSREAMARALPAPSRGTVGDFVRFQTGYAFKSDWFTDSGVRLARNTNVGHGMLDWTETVRVSEERRSEFRRFELVLGDILISLDRPIISTGVKVARVRKEDLPCLLLQRVARAQFQGDGVLPEYFYRWLRSSHFVNAIDPGRSNGVPHISHRDIECIPFTPPNVSDQRRIVADLDAVEKETDGLKRLQAQTAVELDALLPSVLDRAFRGEL